MTGRGYGPTRSDPSSALDQQDPALVVGSSSQDIANRVTMSVSEASTRVGPPVFAAREAHHAPLVPLACSRPGLCPRL
jgi:hypothetical protein